jgi:hypothetical protein
MKAFALFFNIKYKTTFPNSLEFVENFFYKLGTLVTLKTLH